MKSDITFSHSKNLGSESVGEFCGSPILELFLEEMEQDQIVETDRTVKINQRMKPVSTVEVLPGELICDDNIVRRMTTAEANPYFYGYTTQPGTRKVSLAEARQLMDEGAMVTWRPNHIVNALEEFAIVHEG